MARHTSKGSKGREVSADTEGFTPLLGALRQRIADSRQQALRVDSAEARQWYVRMYDDLRRGKGDNPTVGIVLCGSKDQSVARYSVLNGSEQLFASKYRLVLPSEEELRLALQRDREEIEAHKLLRGESEKHD